MYKNKRFPQVKICGLTQPKDAIKCAELGADAIGCVFYPKSPRYLTKEQAEAISSVLPDHTRTVGVFVNETFSKIMRHVERCHLSWIQLHGHESPELVRRLRREGLHVIKALFIDGTPSIEDVSEYPASAYLVECSQGKLPGGNALEWNWETAKGFGDEHPLIVAGGLTPENVVQAIRSATPHAVDVSSGVESDPGEKDLGKVKAFMDAVSRCGIKKRPENIF